MTTKVQDVLEEARQLSPVEQLDLIRALSELLQAQYLESAYQEKIPASVMRAKPVTDLDEVAGDFWPDDESIDEFNSFIKQQRETDRLSDL